MPPVSGINRELLRNGGLIRPVTQCRRVCVRQSRPIDRRVRIDRFQLPRIGESEKVLHWLQIIPSGSVWITGQEEVSGAERKVGELLQNY